MKRHFLVSLLVILSLLCLASAALAAETVVTTAPVAAIKPYGNTALTLTGAAMTEAGYSLGDVVNVSFGDVTVAVPYCLNYNTVDTGCPVLVYRMDKDDHVLAIFNGDFAGTYGLAQKADDGWVSPEGEAVTVTITMNEAGGYYEQFLIRSIAYTDERADYPGLTDEEFANFRAVTTPGIAPGRLFRGASPINDKHNRAAYAAAALEKSGAQVILNLADTAEEMAAFPLYEGSYYAGQQVVCLAMGMDVDSDEFRAKLADGLRFVLANEGPVYIHCLEGKDRTGHLVALLELLAGATADETLADYMQTFRNYYGLTEEDASFQAIADSFMVTLHKVMGDDLDAAAYLVRCGLTQSETDALRARLAE